MLLSLLKSSFRPFIVKNNCLLVYCQKCRRYIEKPLITTYLQYGFVKRFISCSSSLKNHYDTLGIERSASKQDIKEAYIRQSKIYHPDKMLQGFDKQELNNFLKIREAFDVLSNDVRRMEYDMQIFGRSHDVNRFVSGEYKLNRKQFDDDYEPFHVDLKKQHSPKQNHSNSQSSGKGSGDSTDAKASGDSGDASDEEPWTTKDIERRRQLFTLPYYIYTFAFLFCLGAYFYGKHS